MSANRFYSLDIARGLAIIWIILFHLIKYTKEEYGYIIDAIMSRGYVGINLFFMISGYSIYSSISNRSCDIIGYTFLKRRLMRIYIPYWWSLIFASLIVPITIAILKYIKGNFSGIPWTFEYSLADWVEVITLIKIFYAEESITVFEPLYVNWFIAIIVQFYLIVFFIIILRINFLRAALVLSLLSVLSMIPAIKNIIPIGLFLSFWIQFATGIFLYYMIHKVGYSWHISYKYADVLPILLGLMFVVLYALTGVDVYICLSVASVAYFIYPYDHRISIMLPARIIAFVGTISYSLYLIHYPLFWIPRFLSKPFISILLIIVIGYLFYIFFEKEQSLSATMHSVANPLSAIKIDLAQRGIIMRD